MLNFGGVFVFFFWFFFNKLLGKKIWIFSFKISWVWNLTFFFRKKDLVQKLLAGVLLSELVLGYV